MRFVARGTVEVGIPAAALQNESRSSGDLPASRVLMTLRALLERVFLDGLFGFPLVSAGFTGVLVCGHVQHLVEKQRAGMTCV